MFGYRIVTDKTIEMRGGHNHDPISTLSETFADTQNLALAVDIFPGLDDSHSWFVHVPMD
jgi:hypothetical protein